MPVENDKPHLFPTEIWIMIGDLIADERTLKALACTSQWLNQIFVPILRGQLVIRLFDKSADDLVDGGLPPGLGYTKSLEILLWDADRESCDFEFDWDLLDVYAAYVTDLVERMPVLRSFRWDANVWRNADLTARMLLQAHDLLRVLHNHNLLRHQSLQVQGQSMAKYMIKDEIIHFTKVLTGFSNLTSFECYGFYEDEQNLLDELARVLCKSPNLKKLGLGKDCLMSDMDPDIVALGPEDDFLEMLCLQCSADVNFRPLKLECLKLGQGIYLRPTGTNHKNYLAELMDIKTLRELHIWNGMFTDGQLDDPITYSEIAWEMLDHCPMLRQLEVTVLNDPTRRWLNKSGTLVQELIIMQPVSTNDITMHNLDRLRLLNLKVLFVPECSDFRNTYLVSEPNTDTEDEDESVSQSENMTVLGPPVQRSLGTGDHTTDVAKQDFKIDLMFQTVLDRLHDNGRCLEKLAMCLDLDIQWDQFLSQLSTLKRLKQLRLENRRTQRDFPDRHFSRWALSDLWPPGALQRRFAQFLKWKCPSLQFIMLGSLEKAHAWEVTAPSNVASLSEPDIFYQILLRELSPEEIVSLHLFAIIVEEPQCGMSYPHFSFSYSSNCILPRKHDMNTKQSDFVRELDTMEGESSSEESFDIVGELRERFAPVACGGNSTTIDNTSFVDNEAIEISSESEEEDDQIENQAWSDNNAISNERSEVDVDRTGADAIVISSDSEQSESGPRHRKRMRLWVRHEIILDRRRELEIADEELDDEMDEGEEEAEEEL